MPTSDTRTLIIGKATIRITNDHEFFNGWQSGYLAFQASDKQTYSDVDILVLMYARMTDQTNSPLYNAGYVTVWLGERRFQRKVYDKETRPYCHFQGRKVYLRSVCGSKYIFETTREQNERDRGAVSSHLIRTMLAMMFAPLLYAFTFNAL